MRILVAILVVLALLLWGALVWFAFPLIGFGQARPFEPIWVRILMIGVVWFVVGLIYLLRFLKRRRAEKALEAELTEGAVEGDSEVLQEKMVDALAVLKKSSGSKSFLYDLPWYVIIGRPGAGKTTALVNSGLKFPLAEKGKGHSQAGIGGTRNCDWMFTDEAVLIDTAGRYLSQDSDEEADAKSWQSFLQLLKRHRTNQPINGVILTISLADVMTSTEAEREAHADTMRKRLMEIHDTLKVDFPVYVLFTKADLISGFMEYFGSFSSSRRQKVWGHTFQTENRKKQTVREFGEEYDRLVARLSEEVTDRLNEEPDGINRIAIFGFPGQVAMLKNRLDEHLQSIFAHTRYKVNATLRGFYFSSGTQEGTPIDQVLGEMERAGGMVAGGMSGHGKSFFLHDLLRKVIFAEAGWVSTDRRAVRRQKAMRIGGFAAAALAGLAMLGLWGWSFWQNRQLIRTAQAAIADYELAARDELSQSELRSFDVLEVLPYLDMLRNMPLGYAAEDASGSLTERFGLSQRDRLRDAARITYRQALERMFRSRLILRVEQEVEKDVAAGNVLDVYESLKTYKLLGGLAPAPEDDFIRAWFREDWRDTLYPGPANATNRAALEAHLDAMLELDRAQEPSFSLNGALVDNAEALLARMNVADQAYSLIQGTVEFAPIEPFSIVNRAGRDADLVFETIDGAALEDQVIPALYTYAGFHEFFIPQLTSISEALAAEQWLLGSYADDANLDEQVRRAAPILVQRYTDDWIAAWDAVIDNLKLRPMTADSPGYQALAAAAAARTSPILLLADEIAKETSLTQEFDEALLGGAADGVLPNETTALAEREVVRNLTGSQLTIKRFLDSFNDGKGQSRAGAAGGAQRLPGAEIEAHFEEWHLFVEGEPGTRQVDALLQSLSDIQRLLIVADAAPNQVEGQLTPQIGALKQVQSRLPERVAAMVGDVIRDVERTGDTVKIGELSKRLNQQVTLPCEQAIANSFPFASNASRDVSIQQFSGLFAPNGIIDRFFLQELSPLVSIQNGRYTWQGPLADKLSNTTLKQFERAAAIRDAFFADGGGQANVAMSVAPVSIHDSIRTVLLQINGQVINTSVSRRAPVEIKWPGTAGTNSVTLQFLPELQGRQSTLDFPGAWGFLRFINAGSPKFVGPSMQTRHVIGGRFVSYRFDVVASENPFNLSALFEFRCPSGL